MLSKIVGYVELNLNCVYAAVESEDQLLVKHMVVPKDLTFKERPLIRVEMSYTGFSIEPVIIKDQFYTQFTKTTLPKSSVKYWELGWFKADYNRWLVLNQLDKKLIQSVLGQTKEFKPGTHPTTKNIVAISISELLAAHISYGHCCDYDAKDEKFTVDELLSLYIEELDLKSKHGHGLHALVLKKIKSFNLDQFKTKTHEPNFVFGVDAFYKP